MFPPGRTGITSTPVPGPQGWNPPTPGADRLPAPLSGEISGIVTQHAPAIVGGREATTRCGEAGRVRRGGAPVDALVVELRVALQARLLGVAAHAGADVARGLEGVVPAAHRHPVLLAQAGPGRKVAVHGVAGRAGDAAALVGDAAPLVAGDAEGLVAVAALALERLAA